MIRRLGTVLLIATALSISCASEQEVGPLPGVWNVVGRDTNGNSWTATFTLERRSEKYSGMFAWKKNGADAGTEAFTGSYEPATRRVTLVGAQPTGGVVAANYVAVLASDQKTMTDGQWTSPSGTPGTWQARRAAD